MSSEGLPTVRLDPASQGWEYRVLLFRVDSFFGPDVDADVLERHLNQHGEQRWELVSMMPVQHGMGGTAGLMVVFKRPRQ